MLEMEYSDGGDALTLANKNRVASKKIFEQLQQVCNSGRVFFAKFEDFQVVLI